MRELDKYTFIGDSVSIETLKKLLPELAVKFNPLKVTNDRDKVTLELGDSYFLSHIYDENKLEYQLDFVRHAIELTPSLEKYGQSGLTGRFFLLHDVKKWFGGDLQLAKHFIATGFLTGLFRYTSKSSKYDFWPTLRFKETLEDVFKIINHDTYVKPRLKKAMDVPDIFEDGTDVSV